MTTNIYECEGCVDYNQGCIITNKDNCPCLKCLIKPMCHATCEAYEEYVRSLYDNS